MSSTTLLKDTAEKAERTLPNDHETKTVRSGTARVVINTFFSFLKNKIKTVARHAAVYAISS